MKWLFLILAMLFAPMALAQQRCAPRDLLVAKLEGTIKEAVHWLGFAPNPGSLIEIWVNPGGSWTITETYPDGSMCVRSSGVGWEDVEPKPPDAGEDS